MAAWRTHMASGDDTAQNGAIFPSAMFPFPLELDSSISCSQTVFNFEITGRISKSYCRDLTPEDPDLVTQEWAWALGL